MKRLLLEVVCVLAVFVVFVGLVGGAIAGLAWLVELAGGDGDIVTGTALLLAFFVMIVGAVPRV
jgi:hypothetical protein